MGDLGAAARVEDPLKAGFGHVCGFIIEWQRHISSIKSDRSLSVAGDAVMIAPVSNQIPCKQGI